MTNISQVAVTKNDSADFPESYWHQCWKYKDSIKTVYCKLCQKKKYNDKQRLAKLGRSNLSTQ